MDSCCSSVSAVTLTVMRICTTSTPPSTVEPLTSTPSSGEKSTSRSCGYWLKIEMSAPLLTSPWSNSSSVAHDAPPTTPDAAVVA